jgi:ATP-binding cassette subfamily B (MDR/TAP) protein 1
MFSDVDKIQEGTGDKLALLFQYVSVAIAGIIVGFIYGWKMTLVMLAASPFMIIAGAIMGFVSVALLCTRV